MCLGNIYNPFTVKLGRCAGSCNTLSDVSNEVFAKKTKDLDLSVFNMITGINKSKTLTMHISYECKCNLMAKNVFQVNGGITINVDGSVKNITYVTNRK